ncbi:unnamed protein product [Adineta steineri]|uniref:Uncharacterized protein n=1 Tax=Adineta steineri TaxID=433720 RepID=A0A818HDZ0_9BILA|nr:unnamed protein product [Adineta steineri]CAF3506597.1 unnamed protein product [Adineta steineri]
MARNIPRQQPMYISTLNINVDDLDAQSPEDYRYQHSAQETISLKSPKTNTRSYLIILVVILIIITLLSIVALVIGIYSLALATKNSATNTVASTTTVNTATIASSAVCSSTPITSYQYSTATPFQCLNYTNNTDETRNIAYTSSINYCDNVLPFVNTTSVWIRFRDEAGTLIANAPVPPNSCGSVATGWYAGQYPSAAFTTATSIVCFFVTTNTCSACNSISITNCQTFYVFLLPVTPYCNYRYCTL